MELISQVTVKEQCSFFKKKSVLFVSTVAPPRIFSLMFLHPLSSDIKDKNFTF